MRFEKMNLDIIIPIYNDEEIINVLCETIFLELENLFQSVRLILVDDGSNDDSYVKAMEIRKASLAKSF